MVAGDRYEGFAERYDLFSAQSAQRDPVVVEFFRRLVGENNIHSVLDCACGTGHDLILFHSLECKVAGTDISESMLTQARKNLAEADVQVILQRADYRELGRHFDKKFDMVVCLSTSIAEVPDETEALRAFRSMYGVLGDSGILVLTQGTSDRQWHEKPRFIVAMNDDDLTRLFVIDYLGKGARYNILDVFHGKGKREFKQWSIEYPQILLRDDQERLLKEAGFGSVVFYGSYRRDPYDKERSDRLITVARK